MNFFIKDIEGNSHDIGQFEKDFILNNEECNEVDKIKSEYEDNKKLNKNTLIND